MKLISCQIAGFGKFVNRAFDLSAPIVVCKQDNGWGKTTLAAFLETMFYGIDGGRSKQISDNARIKYEPWQSERYGGALTFEYNGKTYRVERFFGKTQSGDIARVFDNNNMLCYDFGDKAERLGETLFGVDRASYRRTAYIPQGERDTNAVTEDIRAKLVALLSTDAQSNGTQTAIDKLDAAERALKAKRKPAKGKIDEIEERISYLQAKQADCLRAREQAEKTRIAYDEQTSKLHATASELQKLGALTEEYTRRGERAANRVARAEMESKLQDAQAELAKWQTFFNGVEPSTLNTAGLERAVEEYYACETQAKTAETQMHALSETVSARNALQTQITACKQTVDGYERLLDAATKAAEKTDKRETTAKTYSDKNRKRGKWSTLLGFVAAVFGGVFSSTNATLGIILLAVGAIAIFVGIGVMLKNTKGGAHKARKRSFTDPELQAEYERELARLTELETQLSALQAGGVGDYDNYAQAQQTARQKMQSLQTAIEGFLSNFRMENSYDYRSALTQIQNGVQSHARHQATAIEYTQKLRSLPPTPDTDVDEHVLQDIQTLDTKKASLEVEKERLQQSCAELRAETQRLETQSLAWSDYAVETQELEREKARLERRLLAIRTAKELLQKARANMASRYLEPVTSACRKYAQIMGMPEGSLIHFTGDGNSVIEENASYKDAAYYSSGMQDLLDFCIRLALAESLFIGRTPVLILDDPFVNFDDTKTEKAKTLIKTLSQNYQILYFTCKSERQL